ncbi:hypothetical protein O9G_005563 [Rozella allomycis CSF55]|uniref:ATP-dependent DNA helicase n=1 Tax=Rozella allomycis (strain CSF55) TaxID=988480 RepID=A0A075APU8_ROZAC|nr:hypothetical protein O9G_005563 [Rozella allomycis CSF55]|eukprot:EPZ30765.1 hypothetical protein O9G_005563 [Rozella allomycis CSF55]
MLIGQTREYPNLSHLNNDQLNIIQALKPFFERLFETPPKILINGGPGTGKSFVVTTGIVPLANFYGLNTLSSAFTGSAAVNLNGHTIHSLLMPKCSNTSSTTKEQYLAPLSTTHLAKLQDIFQNINEISTISTQMFNAIDKRLQQAKNNQYAFGGLCMILTGDFFQMKPTTGKMIYSDLVKFCIKKENITSKNISSAEGAKLFTNFQLFELTKQMRAAKDPIHVQRINHIRSYNENVKLSNKTINMNKTNVLKTSDFIENSNWLNGPIIVHDNTERLYINNVLGQAFAKKHGVPIIRWKCSFKCATLDKTDVEAFFESHIIELMDSFIQGATVYINENSSTQRKIVNGTKAKMHSLSFPESLSTLQKRQIKEAIDNATPGQVVILPITPTYILVTLDNANKDLCDSKFYYNENILIPIPLERFPSDPIKLLFNGKKHNCYVKKHALDL